MRIGTYLDQAQAIKDLLTLHIFCFFFFWIMVLNYQFYWQTSLRNFLLRNFFFSKLIEKITILIYSNQEYYCHLFQKVCLHICPLSFIQTYKIMSITGSKHMWACVNNYWKYVCGCLCYCAAAYTLEFSRKKIFCVQLCETRNFCCKLFLVNLPKVTNNRTLRFARLHIILSAKLYISL